MGQLILPIERMIKVIRPDISNEEPAREGHYFAEHKDRNKWHIVRVVKKNGALRGHIPAESHWINNFSNYVWSEQIGRPLRNE